MTNGKYLIIIIEKTHIITKKELAFMNICVFGAASEKIDKAYMDSAFKAGEMIALRGHGLVYGAGGTGMMGAAARGAKKHGGSIYGVIPTFFKEIGAEIIFSDCTEIKYTDTMRERKAEMEDKADAFLVLPGGIGTFEEFFEILTLKQLGRHEKPIAVFNVMGYYDSLCDMMDSSVIKKFVPEYTKDIYKVSDDLSELFAYMENDPREKVDTVKLKY